MPVFYPEFYIFSFKIYVFDPLYDPELYFLSVDTITGIPIPVPHLCRPHIWHEVGASSFFYNIQLAQHHLQKRLFFPY